MDSDSSVDRVECDGKLYRLKCDCCKSKRAEAEYDFHPCQVEKCTFAICCPCLHRWKDQSDKDVTKRFECPQCHTEYDTQVINEHKPLSSELIKTVNEKAKHVRKLKKKRRKKHTQSKKQTERLKYLEQRRLALNTSKKKKNNNSKNKKSHNNNNNNHSHNHINLNRHVLNKHRVIVSFENNLIVAQQWNEQMIKDIFGRIGPIHSYNKTGDGLSIDFKKCQSDKCRRVLLYVFDLNITIDDMPIRKNDKCSENDCFNPNMIGGKKEFLSQRDKRSNWKEYTIPPFKSIPPGCRRWINAKEKRVTKDTYLLTMHKRSNAQSMRHRNQTQTQTQSHAHSQLSDIHRRPPPITQAHSLGYQLHNNNSNGLNLNRSNSSDHLYGNVNTNGNANQWNTTNHTNTNTNANGNGNANTNVSQSLHRKPLHNTPPGMPHVVLPKMEPGIVRSVSDNSHRQWHNGYNYKHDREPEPEPGALVSNEKKRKIANLLGMGMGNKSSPALTSVNGLKWQRKSPEKLEEKKDISRMLRWKSNHIIKRILIVSDEDELSDDTYKYTADITQQNSTDPSLHTRNTYKPDLINHDSLSDNEYDYDYSDSSEEDMPASFQNRPKNNCPIPQPLLRAPIIKPPAHEMELERLQKQKKIAQIQTQAKRRQSPPHSPPKQTQIELDDMTIQDMLDNLDNFESNEVDQILNKLLLDANKNSNGTPVQNSRNDGYDYDDSEDSNYNKPKTLPPEPGLINSNDDLDFIAKSMGGSGQYQTHEPNKQSKPNNYHSPKAKSHKGNHQSYKIKSPNHKSPNHTQSYNPNTFSPQNNNNGYGPGYGNPYYNHEPEPGTADVFTDPFMEKYRGEFEEIGRHMKVCALAKFPDIYFEQFGITIKSTYNGKLKDLIKYFSDIFELKYNPRKNSTTVLSLLYGSNNGSNHKIQQIKSMIQNEKNKRRGKSTAQLRWTPKRKECEPPKSEEMNEMSMNDSSDFRFGPSTMYTVPRAVPKSHSHLIGQTAAVGKSNKYKSSARSYVSHRRSGHGYGARKVKTFGDYEDELPHTPSASDDD